MQTIMSFLPWVFVALVLMICFEVVITQLLGKNRGWIRIKRRNPNAGANPEAQSGETPTSETPTSETSTSKTPISKFPSPFQFSLKFEFRPVQLRSFWWSVPFDIAGVVLNLFGLAVDLFLGVVFGLMELLMLLIEVVFGLIELALGMMIPLAIAGLVIYAIIGLLCGK